MLGHVDNRPNRIQDEHESLKSFCGLKIMELTQELVDAIYRERVLRARVTSPEQKLLDCFRLFEFTYRIMSDGIRNENPRADERQIQELVSRRFEILSRLEPVR
jgi:hypothetical protein